MNRIEEAITYGYKFDMGRYFSDGWDYFKREAGSFIGFTVLYFVIILLLAMIPMVNIISSVVQYVFIAGIYIFIRNMKQGAAEFGDFFQGFNYFVQIFIYWVVLIVFMLPAIITFFIYFIPHDFFQEIISGRYAADPEYFSELFIDNILNRAGSIVFLGLLLAIYAIYISVSYSLTLVFIADRQMTFWDAMESSRKVVAKNFFYFLLMFIVLGLIVSVGTIITCGLGLLVGVPFIYSVTFAAYENIVGPAGGDDAEEVLEVDVIE